MDNKKIAKKLNKIAKELLSVEFPNQKAMNDYLKQHPLAQRKNHSVKPSVSKILIDPKTKMEHFGQLKSDDQINIVLEETYKRCEDLANGENITYKQVMEDNDMPIERGLESFSDLYYQTYNNGIQGYIDNGTCLDIGESIKLVNQIDSSEAKELSEILTDYSEHINFDAENGETNDGYILTEECYSCGGDGQVEDAYEDDDYCECEECGGTGQYADSDFYEQNEDRCWELLQTVRNQINSELLK